MAAQEGEGMTNLEKLREVFPHTIFIFQKKEDKTAAIMCSDEWLNAEYEEMYKAGDKEESDAEFMCKAMSKTVNKSISDKDFICGF